MVGVVSFMLFCVLTYKTRMVYYRERGLRRLVHAGLWAAASVACLLLSVASAMSPRF